MLPVIHSIRFIARSINKAIKDVNRENINTFYDIVVGKGIEDTSSMIGSLYSIINEFNKFSKKSILFAAIIAAAMNPILNTISKFIKIISKVATLTYISGYDHKGNPIFQKLPPSVFADAAIAVSNGFGTFIQMLNDKFKEIDVWAIIGMK